MNPLAKHFRQPKLYLPLPSKGEFWEAGSIDLPESGEIPIYPMTAKDEITLRTPDAVLNGLGTVSVIHSCCPNIQDAWKMPSIDLDAVLIAIRIASYGEYMSFATKCPKCSTEHDYDADMRIVLDSIKKPDYATPLVVENMQIKIRPQSYFSANATSQIQFEEQRIIRAMNEDTPDDIKSKKFQSHLNALVDLNIKTLADSTESITIGAEVVTDKAFLTEFYQNCDTSVIKLVQARLADIAKQASIPAIDVRCDNCENEFKVDITFEYASFFANGS